MVRVYKNSKCQLLIEVPKFLKQYFVKHLLDDMLLLQTQILLLKSDISTGQLFLIIAVSIVVK